MKILYLHQYFRTPEEGGAIRSWYLSKALAEAGHDVTLITSHNHHLTKTKDINGVKVIYLPVNYSQTYGIIRRFKSFYEFSAKAYKAALPMSPDICFATSTPLTIGWTAIKLKKKKGIPFIFEVRDLWPEVPIQLGVLKDPFTKIIARKLERTIYTEADKIVTLSPGISDAVKRIVPEKPVIVIPNISDTDFYKTDPDSSSQNSERTFTICYTGALGKANGIGALLDLAEETQRRSMKVSFIISGTGSEAPFLQNRVDSLDLKNVSFTGHLSKEEVAKVLQTSDASYISFADYPILGTSSPNKLFDALAAGKICISNTGGWIKELIELNQCGFYYSPGQPAVAADQIQKLIKSPEKVKILKMNARKLAEMKFSLKALSSEFVKLF